MGIGAALAVLTALLCLAVMATRDGRTISLAELSSLNAPLMSCESTSSAVDGLLWCSDPNSPHCIPAVPDPPRLDISDRPDLCTLSAVELTPATFVLLPWPNVAPDQTRGRNDVHRLERPPRA
jgi:hypothetical protein